jgi:divalent metal cation (Fe/Co/Zn/Cd) transporter
MIPAVILGRMKIPLARELHDKVLFADADMNKADWMTAGAAILGVLGIRYGFWWADGAAASFISLTIVSDGIKNLKTATGDLMDKRPHLVDNSAVDPLTKRLETEMKSLPWVTDARVLVRDEGHVMIGDVLVQVGDETDLVDRIKEAREQLLALDWRLHDVLITPVREELGP